MLNLVIQVIPGHLSTASVLHSDDFLIRVIHYDAMRLVLLLDLSKFHTILIYL